MSIFQQRKKAFLSNTVTEKNKRKMYFYFCKNKNYKKKYQVKLSHNFLYVHEWKTARTFHVKQYFSLLLPNVLKVKQTCYRPYIQILLHFVAVLRCSLHLFFQKKKKINLFPVNLFTSWGSMIWRTGGFGFGSSGWRTLSRSVAIASSSIADTWSLSTIQYSWSNYKKSLNKLAAELSWDPFIRVHHTMHIMKIFLE